MIGVIEDNRNEFKIKLSDDFEKEVIAFLNTDGGNIFIGIDDKGNISNNLGNIDLLQRKIKDRIKDNIAPSTLGLFDVGYTVFITNELSYSKKPLKSDCIYNQFSLEEGTVKKGILNWGDNASEGTKKNFENPIVLKNEYKIKWNDYSKIDDTGKFIVLVNKVIK